MRKTSRKLGDERGERGVALTVEICAGSLADCLAAERAGADRVELNSAIWLGGLTPSMGTFRLAKEALSIPIVCMLRPRGAGFYYSEEERDTMFADARGLLTAGADGLAFGFLRSDGCVDEQVTRQMAELAHAAGAEAVFHRAFDVTPDAFAAAEALIGCGVDRVLTSGQRATAHEGAPLIRELQQRLGERIQILAGSGIDARNVTALVGETGVAQVHASCRGYMSDPTTRSEHVSYAYLDGPNDTCHDGVDEGLARKLVNLVGTCCRQGVGASEA